MSNQISLVFKFQIYFKTPEKEIPSRGAITFRKRLTVADVEMHNKVPLLEEVSEEIDDDALFICRNLLPS